MVRPKFCNVSAREVCAMASSSLSDFKAIRCSKRSISSDFLRARLSNVSINDIRIVSCAQLAWQICRVQKKPASGIPDAAAIANALVDGLEREIDPGADHTKIIFWSVHKIPA